MPIVGLVFALQAGSAAYQREAATRVDAAFVAQALWAPRSADVVVPPSSGEKVVNGRLIDHAGTGTVTYTVMERCDRAAARLVAHFRASAWRPRSSKILMPRLRTSFTTGCERVPSGILSPDSTTKDDQYSIALSWHGEWDDNAGNTLTYDVSSRGNRTHVRATFLPAEVAVSRGLRTKR